MDPRVIVCFMIMHGAQNANDVISAAIPLIEKAGIKVEVKAIIDDAPDFYPAVTNPLEWTRKYFDTFEGRGCYLHVISGRPHGTLAGISNGNCTKRPNKMSISFTGGTIPDTQVAAEVLAHELGHQFGMTHGGESGTIDEPFAGTQDHWSRRAIRQMRKCLKSRK